MLAAARDRPDYPGGSDRAVQEVQGDIVALRFIDRLLTEVRALEGSRHPDVGFVLNCVAEELFPILAHIAPPRTETMSIIDYTPSRTLKRREAIGRIPARDVPSVLISTLHDDNVGVLPQITTGSHHELLSDLKRAGWAGFSTRYWLIGDHDGCVSYLARAAWEEGVTPRDVYREEVTAQCGPGCVDDMLEVFARVEATTVDLEWHGLGLTFTVPGMMVKHWSAGELPAELAQDREGYREALAAALLARGKATRGEALIDYWIGRLRFGIGYIDCIELVHRAASAEGRGDRKQALELGNRAVQTVSDALETYAQVARDRSDVGAIAVMDQFVYRDLKAKVATLEE